MDMARVIGKLTALAVEKTRTPGVYADGGGLYLRVTGQGTKSWFYRFMLDGKAHWMGLGPVHTIGLVEARDKATDCRRLLLEGIDPIEARKAARMKARLEAANAITFAHAAVRYVEAHRAGWRNAKHAAQWATTIATYANPIIGDLPVQAITTALVMQVLQPLWSEKPETASRLRGRIEAVLDWARVQGYREGENPARWRGHLAKLLPARAKVRKVKHHAALPYAEIGGFMVELRAREDVAARALEFTILTACRTGEVLGVPWGEIDLAARLWTIPAERTKTEKEHRVPLSGRAIAILKEMRALRDGDERQDGATLVFPSTRHGMPLGDAAMLRVLATMGHSDLTVHGLRSSFRDWASERTNFPRDAAELALGHAVGDKVEAAYRRGDLFEKRRRLMDAWGAFCAASPSKGGNVVAIDAALSA
jgi:integrase